MKPQKQKFRHAPAEGIYGDCHRTAIAVLLDLDRDAVPHFGEGGRADGEFHEAVEAWLRSRGLTEISVLFPPEAKLDDVLMHIKNVNGSVAFILGGTSRNGVGHSVVCCDGVIACDPSIDDSGIVGPLHGWWWVTFIGAAVTRVAA